MLPVRLGKLRELCARAGNAHLDYLICTLAVPSICPGVHLEEHEVGSPHSWTSRYANLTCDSSAQAYCFGELNALQVYTDILLGNVLSA